MTLQEANAIAAIDLNSLKVTGIYSAGYEDYSTVAVDIDKKDEAYDPKTYDSLRGIRMPDSIALYSVGGTDYVVTANEGDSREWGDYLNEDERDFKDGQTSPTGKITAKNSGLTGKVVFFDSSDYDGLDTNLDYLFGGRSFTVYKADGNGLTEVFDSGSDFEAKTAIYVPENFNCSNDDKSIDDRSGKKGPESESVTLGTVGEKTYAFVGLERVGRRDGLRHHRSGTHQLCKLHQFQRLQRGYRRRQLAGGDCASSRQARAGTETLIWWLHARCPAQSPSTVLPPTQPMIPAQKTRMTDKSPETAMTRTRMTGRNQGQTARIKSPAQPIARQAGRALPERKRQGPETAAITHCICCWHWQQQVLPLLSS